MLNEAQAFQTAEQAVRNIVDLGIIPMVTFGAVLHNLRILENPLGFRLRRALLVGVLTGLSFLGAACTDGHSLKDANPTLHTELMLSQADAQELAQEARQRQAEQNSQSENPPQVERERSYLPQEYPEFWYVEATVMPGEGVVQALSREAGAPAEQLRDIPEGLFEAIIIYHDGAPTDMPPEVLSWDQLKSNPLVYHNDRVRHQLLSQEGFDRLRWEHPSLVANLD